MKRSFFSITFLFVTTMMVAQYNGREYFPIGTEWIEVIAEPDVPLNTTVSNSYKIKGETLINGTIYKEVSVNDNEPELWLRESDNCVWLLTADLSREIKIYDFNWNSGQTLQTEYVVEKADGQKIIATEELPTDFSTVTIGSTSYQYYTNLYGTVICGIGRVSELSRNSSLLGYSQPEMILPGLQYWKVLWISQNGETIFKSDIADEWITYCPNSIITSIHESNLYASPMQASTIYNLQGHLITLRQRGLYIRGGKKYVVK